MSMTPPSSLSRLAIGLLAAATAVAAHAGVEFTANLRSETAGTRLPALGEIVVKGRVDGDKGRLEYLRSALQPKGSIVVTTDGARTAKLYKPKSHDCGDMPLPGSAANGMRAQAVGLNRYDDIKVEKTLDEAGAKLHGIATRHLRYAISYVQHPPGAARAVRGSIEFEAWLAPTLTDPALDLWLGSAVRTGNEQADHEIATGMADAKGAALKRIQRSTLQVEGAKAQQSTSTLEVTQLAKRKLSAKSLAAPFVCRVGASPG